jgi:hypothetical protein
MFALGVTPDAATTAKVDAHVQLVEQALLPWAASIHYANFDERPGGGRNRFHDQATLQRLRAVKTRVDPTEMFTGAHQRLVNDCSESRSEITLSAGTEKECPS